MRYSLTTALHRYFKPADDVLPSPTGDLSTSVSQATIKGRGPKLALALNAKTAKISSSLSSIRPSQCPPLEESVLGYFLAGFDPRPLLPPVYGWQKKEWRGTFHHIHRDIA